LESGSIFIVPLPKLCMTVDAGVLAAAPTAGYRHGDGAAAITS